MTWIARTVPFAFGFHGDERALGDVERRDVIPGDLLRARGRAGRPNGGELPADVDAILGDHDHVHAPVRLPCRRRHGRHDRERRRADRKPAHSHSSGHCSRPQYPSPHQPPRDGRIRYPSPGYPRNGSSQAGTAIPRRMDGARGPEPHTGTMEPAVFEYPPCPLRDASQAVAAAFPPLRAIAALAWPAARRAERVEVSEDGIAARSLAGASLDRMGRRRRGPSRAHHLGPGDGPRHRANRLPDRDRRDDPGLRRARRDAPSALAQTGSLNPPSPAPRHRYSRAGRRLTEPSIVLRGARFTGSRDPRTRSGILKITGDDRSRGSGVRSEHTIM